MNRQIDDWRQAFIDGLRRHSVVSVISRQPRKGGNVFVILTKELPDLMFGAGQRICLGRHLAIEEGGIVLQWFFEKFTVQKIEVPAGPLKQNIMHIDQPGKVMVTVRRRSE